MAEEQDFGGPYLAAAHFCEKVLAEKDGVLSAIRIIDRITVTASGAAPPEKMPQATIGITAFISFKSGFFKGSAEIKLVGRNPSQKVFANATLPMLFEGEDRGATSVLQMNMAVNEDGLYWFDVLIGDRLITRMPLRVIYQRITSGPGTGLARQQ